MHWIALAVDTVHVEVERGREEDLRPAHQTHHGVALVLRLDPVQTGVRRGIERAVDARRRDDALANRDGVDLAATHGQRALRALERLGRSEDEQELVHCVSACGCKQKSTGLPQGGAQQLL